MLRPAALVLASLLACAATQAAAEPVWSAEDYDYGSALSLGVADSPEEVTLSLYCDNEEEYLELSIFQELEGVEAGTPVEIRISSGTATATVAGEAATDEMSGFVYGSATGFALGPLLAVLRSPGPVVVTMGSVTVNLPVEGRAAAITTFAVGCRLS